MKKLFIIMLLFGLLCQSTYADGNEIHFTTTIIDHSSSTQAGPKTPIRPLTATLDGNVLTLSRVFGDTVPVELLDEDGDTVYTDYLLAGQTSLTLPSTLSGEYTLRLTVGIRYYIGIFQL